MLTDRISPQEDIGADDMAQTLPSLHGEGSGVGPVTSTTTETVIEKHQQRELKATGRRAQLGNKAAGRRLKAVNPSLQEDTLGSGIWQSERNVMRAMQMLSECEAIIEKSEREVRNSIVRATFNAVPQPATAVLVTDELGDCYVSDTNRQTVIEL